MRPRRPVLVACANPGCCRILTAVLGDWGFEVALASSAKTAVSVVDGTDEIELVFCDASPADGGFGDLLSAIARRKPPPRLVALIQKEDDYSEAIRLGAFDALPLACQRSDVQWMMINALRDKNNFRLPTRTLRFASLTR